MVYIGITVYGEKTNHGILLAYNEYIHVILQVTGLLITLS